MKTSAVLGTVGLIVGLVVGGFSGSRLERRSNEKRIAVAVRAEAAHTERLAAELYQLNQLVGLTQIHLRLGRIAMEADRQDYGAAGDRAARFFDDVARMAPEMKDDKERAALQQVLAARDELIAGLATAKPSAAQRLKQLYLELFAMGAPPT